MLYPDRPAGRDDRQQDDLKVTDVTEKVIHFYLCRIRINCTVYGKGESNLLIEVGENLALVRLDLQHFCFYFLTPITSELETYTVYTYCVPFLIGLNPG